MRSNILQLIELVVILAFTPNLPTKILDFRGFYSSRILNLRGGIPRPKGDFPEYLIQ